MAAEDGGEVAKFVVDLVRAGDGLGDGVADGLAPGLAEAVEVDPDGAVGAAGFPGDLLDGGGAGVGEDPGAEDGQPLAGGRGALFERKKREIDSLNGLVGVVRFSEASFPQKLRSVVRTA
jgi:hypothetical protein